MTMLTTITTMLTTTITTMLTTTITITTAIINKKFKGNHAKLVYTSFA